jgi:hypothetical protein
MVVSTGTVPDREQVSEVLPYGVSIEELRCGSARLARVSNLRRELVKRAPWMAAGFATAAIFIHGWTRKAAESIAMTTTVVVVLSILNGRNVADFCP